MAKKNLIDLEKDKFDNDGRVRVALDATADQDVVVKNADSEPVPVKIINTDTSIDLEVNIGESITIDTTTPLDVNVTNTSVDVNITALDGDGDLGVKIQNTSDINVNVTNTSINTNATIQNTNLDVNLTDLDINGRLPVSVDNTPNVNVTNSSLNTNATIQNVSLDVNLTDLNVSSQLPVSVDNQPTVTVDDSTPVDINVTNTSINTNATIQGTPAVTVSGDVSIDDATAIRVDITNASIATNATIQNSYINVYDKLYDGSTWVNQLSDSDGKAIVLEKKYYSASDITALGSSTSVREWLNAYADGILEYKYVGSYDDQFEVEVYLTHPDLGDSNKCLKLIYDYSTQNSVKVVQSVYCSVVDWTFDDSVTGALTITLGTITSPDPNTSIAVGTDICSVAVSNTGQGSITISLSGTHASLYTLVNVTDAITGSSLSYDPLKSYALETASDFSGASYSHSMTITATNNLYGNIDVENVSTSGTYVAAPDFTNESYVGIAATSTNDGTTYSFGGIDAYGTSKENRTIKHAFHGMGYLRSGGNQDYIGFPATTENYSFSFWFKIESTSTFTQEVFLAKSFDVSAYTYRLSMYFNNSAGSLRLLWTFGRTSTGYNRNAGSAVSNISGVNINTGDWHHIACTRNASTGSAKIYIDGVLKVTQTLAPDSTWLEIDNPSAWSSSFVSSAYACGLQNNPYTSTNPIFFMDEVTTFNLELPATGSDSVESLYNSNNGVIDMSSFSGCIGWWRFGDGDDGGSNVDTTLKIYDMSGNGNDTTVQRRAPTLYSATSNDSIYVV